MSKKTKTKVEPAAFTKPYVTDGLSETQSAYRGAQPIRDTVTSGLGGAFTAASANATRANPYAGIGANDPSMGLLSGMAGQRQTGDYSGFGGANPGFGLLSAATQRGADGQAGADYFRKVAGGGFLNGNPYLDSVIGASIEDANDAANSQFSLSGRYGSGAHSGVLAKNAGRISNEARMAAYEAERGRMGEASGMLGEFDARDRGFSLNAGSTMGSLFNQGEGLRLNALQSGDAARQAEYDGRLRAAGLLGDQYTRGEGLRLDAQRFGDQAQSEGYRDLLALGQGYMGSPFGLLNPYVDNLNSLTSPYTVTKGKTSGLGQVMGVINDTGQAAATAYAGGRG